MTRILLDSELRAKPGDLTKDIELCDEKGHLVAQIIPMNQILASRPYISPEELERIRNSTEWYTTAEVWPIWRNYEL